MAGNLISPIFQFPNKTVGKDNVGCKIYCYAAGTSTPLVAYQDAALSTPHANPVVMDANGQKTIFLGNSNYKFVGTDAADNVLWTKDGCCQNGVGDQSIVGIATGNLINMVNLAPIVLTAGGAQVIVNVNTEWNGSGTFTAAKAGTYRIWGIIDVISNALTTGLGAGGHLAWVNAPGGLRVFRFDWPFADLLVRRQSVPYSCVAKLTAGQVLQVGATCLFAGTAPQAQINGLQITRLQ